MSLAAIEQTKIIFDGAKNLLDRAIAEGGSVSLLSRFGFRTW
jgi:hypothetical protein